MSWYYEPGTIGHIVAFDADDGGRVWFRPNQYGRVRAVFCANGATIDLQAIANVALGVARQLPETRFGNSHSSLRGILCSHLSSALNGAGVRPGRKQPA